MFAVMTPRDWGANGSGAEHRYQLGSRLAPHRGDAANYDSRAPDLTPSGLKALWNARQTATRAAFPGNVVLEVIADPQHRKAGQKEARHEDGGDGDFSLGRQVENLRYEGG
jgi:hypothetical protein